jgi:Type II CAAX prenyl endopeptidase Rce1-like
MKTKRSRVLASCLNIFPENILFLVISCIILSFPLIATAGQFFSTNYFGKVVPVLLLFWPGSDFEIKVHIVVWLFMGLVIISYITGVAYMFHKKTLGKVILITIMLFIFSVLLRTLLTHVFGFQENAMPDLAGKANAAILSQWHNPIWEEIVFRGIPLLILLAVEKYITKKRTLAGVLIYCLVPSLIFGFYHIPGHGIIRFFDTLVLGAGFAWLALKFTFFAPVVMHYIADAMIVLSLTKIPTVQPSEVEWLTRYGPSLNTFSSLALMLLIVLIPVLSIYYFLRIRKDEAAQISI